MCARARRDSTRGMLRRCFQGTMDCRPVQWVYVLDSGQRSSVTVKPHHPAGLTAGWRRRGGGRRRREDRTLPYSLRNTCRCLRRPPDRASLRIHIIYARVDIYRETRNVRAGINKAPYWVNYGSSGVSRRSRLGLKVASERALIEAR